MADHFRTMAFSIDTERLSLRLRTKDDAECNLELLREHEGGSTLSLDEVEQRMVEQNKRAQVEGFGAPLMSRKSPMRSFPNSEATATQQRPLAL